LLGQAVNTLRQRLREFYKPAAQKGRRNRTELAPVQVDIMDAQPAGFQDAQARAVLQLGRHLVQALGPGDGLQHLPHLRARHDHGQAFRPPGPHGVQPRQLDLQDLLIKEQQREERLLLGAGGDVLVDRQVSEERFDLGRSHVAGVALVVEEDEGARPAGVAFPGPVLAEALAGDLANEVEEARGLRGSLDGRGLSGHGILPNRKSSFLVE
jgi:hypothetical protein